MSLKKLSAVLFFIVLALGSVARAVPFELLVTQSPQGPANTDPSTWGGVLRYTFANNGAAAVPDTGIGSASLNDPAGLVYRSASNELLVGNRHGNQAASSVNRFTHPAGGAFTANGVITGNNLFGVHQLALSPTSGELFAVNVNNGVSRFTFAGTVATPNGMISNGSARGVAVSPDGARLYVTGASNSIRQFDIASGTELAAVTVAGASSLHYLRFRGNNELYAADFGTGDVFRFSVASNNLTSAGVIDSTGALGIAFSPDLNEMFIARHGTGNGFIDRLTYNGGSDSWTPAGVINAGTSLGDIIVIPVPEPALVAAPVFLGLAAMRRKRR